MLLVYTLEGGPLRCMLLPCCVCFPCLSGAWPASPLPPVSVWEGRFGCLKLKRCHFLVLSVLATLMNLADIGKVLGLSEGRGGMCGCALSQELCWGRMRFPLISALETHRPHHHKTAEPRGLPSSEVLSAQVASLGEAPGQFLGHAASAGEHFMEPPLPWPHFLEGCDGGWPCGKESEREPLAQKSRKGLWGHAQEENCCWPEPSVLRVRSSCLSTISACLWVDPSVLACRI